MLIPMIRWVLVAAASSGGILPYIGALYPLKNIVAESEIATGVVETTDLQSRTSVVRITKALKGTCPYTHVRMNLAATWSPWQRDEAARHLVPGTTVVVFDGILPAQAAAKGEKRKALLYANRFFLKFAVKSEGSPANERYDFEQIEIMLNRTFNGTVEELDGLILAALSGRQTLPAPDPRIPHIRKEDVLALPAPGTKIPEDRLPAPFRRIGAPSFRVPENPAEFAPGLRFEYYEGAWKEVPDFSLLTPIVSGVTPRFEPSERRREKDVGLRFTGFLDVPQDGTYVFTTSSPGPHRIFLGKAELVVRVEKVPVDAGIDLKAGRHAITVLFVDGGRGGNLKVWWAGPGLAKQPIPATALFHAP